MLLKPGSSRLASATNPPADPPAEHTAEPLPDCDDDDAGEPPADPSSDDDRESSLDYYLDPSLDSLANPPSKRTIIPRKALRKRTSTKTFTGGKAPRKNLAVKATRKDTAGVKPKQKRRWKPGSKLL
jgi:hypothetical protein